MEAAVELHEASGNGLLAAFKKKGFGGACLKKKVLVCVDGVLVLFLVVRFFGCLKAEFSSVCFPLFSRFFPVFCDVLFLGFPVVLAFGGV